MSKIYILIVLLPHLVYTIVRGTTGISQERNTNSNNNINNCDCGITGYYTESTNNLIPNGEHALPGQWPWVAALLTHELMGEYGFLCPGSILTNRHILTAAKCLQLSKSKNDIANPYKLEVALGQFELRQPGSTVVGNVTRKVASYKIHPDFNIDASDSDLAILILETPVEFSPFIKPICLWSGSTNLENVVGRTGYVVGWLINEPNSPILVSEPRMLRIPIVNQETCLRSNQSFHNLTSERTFCAGLLSEIGPCFGDYGSGLVLFDNSTGRYHLRGVLSFFVQKYTSDLSDCDFSKYVIYVDVAKYLQWIQQQISIMQH
ncbi:serine protease gd-like [Temnothorax curvispinosus]|uniref:Serine protease gd-like n=1 Tax=Temnothorax curvispinosus TaxID=300111 RepID=A0A6J1PQ93_9HYME|nr:serine protease gd-like [Temnothorax curvispinosus]